MKLRSESDPRKESTIEFEEGTRATNPVTSVMAELKMIRKDFIEAVLELTYETRELL
jgi:hypothetical protein